MDRPSFPSRWVQNQIKSFAPLQNNAPIVSALKGASASQNTINSIAQSPINTRAIDENNQKKIRLKTLKSTNLQPLGIGSDCVGLRNGMVRKLAENGIESLPVLQAMQRVQRHQFVDSALINQSYEDTSLPIGMGQTISKPSIVARMLELLLCMPNCSEGIKGRVLEIGTGCGYQAALLSLLAHEVYSIERIRTLHHKAQNHLRPLRLPNVHLIFGDGIEGFIQGAPYAAIIVAAGGSFLPSAWCDQLAVGGRLVAPLVMRNNQQSLVVIDRTIHGWHETILEPVHFVPLKSGLI